MKKIFIKLFFLFFFLTQSYAEQFWSNELDGPLLNEEAIKLLNGKK